AALGFAFRCPSRRGRSQWRSCKGPARPLTATAICERSCDNPGGNRGPNRRCSALHQRQTCQSFPESMAVITEETFDSPIVLARSAAHLLRSPRELFELPPIHARSRCEAFSRESPNSPRQESGCASGTTTG